MPGIANRDLQVEWHQSAGIFHRLLTRLVNGWPQNRIDELMPWLGDEQPA